MARAMPPEKSADNVSLYHAYLKKIAHPSIVVNVGIMLHFLGDAVGESNVSESAENAKNAWGGIRIAGEIMEESIASKKADALKTSAAGTFSTGALYFREMPHVKIALKLRIAS